MSHFLQRLAASVTAPQTGPRLRPLSGSIYSPLTGRAADGPATLAEARAPVMGREVTGMRADERLAGPDRLHKSHTREGNAQSHVLRSTEPGETLVPAAKPMERAPDMAVDDWAPEHRSKSTAREGSRGKAAERRDDSGGIEAASLRGAQTGEALLPPVRPLATAEDARARVVNRPAEGRSAAQTREADEITIHIGRVEVAAIAQPVSRPAAAPARRAMSLDEYLKRGNGRAR